jgi:DNA-binding SARP family transcriptional activator
MHTRALRLFTFGRLAVEPSEGLVPGGPRPYRLALLAILASRGPRGQTRERVLAILWPDSNEARGRHALSQTLYALRQDLGFEVVRAGEVLQLDPGLISSDVDDFRIALEGRDWARAAGLYAGPFAAGFTLSNSPGFEEWLDNERLRLAREGHKALIAAAQEAEAGGDLAGAVPHWRRLVSSEPLSTRYTLGYIKALSRIGERAEALEIGLAHAELLRRELEAQPDPELTALISELRPRPSQVSPPLAENSPTVAAMGALRTSSESPTSASRRRYTRTLLAAILAAVVLVSVAWRLSVRRNSSPLPVLAVGLLRDRVSPDSGKLDAVLSDMLSTNLARVSALEIIVPTRLLQAMPSQPDSTGRAISTAARRAGAAEILEGEVTSHPAGLRLTLRRVDLERGRLRRGYIVTASDRFALIDSATAVLTRDLELLGPASSVADVTTRSPMAYRLYEEGLRTYFQSDWATASRLFRAALAEDSSFAQAGFYAWRTAESAAKDSLEPILLRLADRAPDRERLLARTFLGTLHSDPPALALADSLDQRFPSDPDAVIASAFARLHRHGFTPDVIQQFERALTLDSLSGPAALRGARVAEALTGLQDAYAVADSSRARERTLRRWMTLQPENATPLFYLSGLLERLGQVEDADWAYARYEEMSLVKTSLVQAAVWKAINRGDADLLLQTCRAGLSSVSDVVQFTDFRWRCLLAYRHLGRLREARELTRPRRLTAGQGKGNGVSVGVEGLNQVLLDWMTGRPGVAARGFLEIAANQRSASIWPGENARRETWWLTLAATAFVAAGDTAAASGLVDSIRTVGARSIFGRDPVLHHFVRGLLLSVEKRHAEAMGEFLRANYSWTLGYTRINYEYARCALARGRPREAIYPLQAALRGGMEGPQLYVTQTELHELLAQTFEAAGMADSARSHYGYVARMWTGADREFASRHRRATEWLRRHSGT